MGWLAREPSPSGQVAKWPAGVAGVACSGALPGWPNGRVAHRGGRATGKNGIFTRQATSDKRQATSDKRQATSDKRRGDRVAVVYLGVCTGARTQRNTCND